MSEKDSFLAPKFDDLEKLNLGQGCIHELPLGRNWEKALDAVHFILENKWYYIGTASNTEKGFFKPLLKKGMSFSRKQKDLPLELEQILEAKFQILEELDYKIKKTAIAGSGNKDVWQFTSRWKDFPKGTMVIVVFQQVLKSLFSGAEELRKALIIIDGRSATADQNKVMLVIRRVFIEKGYSSRILKIKKNQEPVEKTVTMVKSLKETAGAHQVYNGRLAGELVILLNSNFKAHIGKITDSEKRLLDIYFKKIKKSNEYNLVHKKMEQEVEEHFLKREEEKQRRTKK